MKKLIVVVMFGLSLSACKVGPDYETPVFDEMDKWENAPPERQAKDKISEEALWWENYKDPLLNDLIKQTIDSNYDLKIAYAKVEQAKAHLLESESELYPSLDASGFVSRDKVIPKLSLAPAVPFGSEINFFNTPQNFNLSHARLGASWEIDLFGRVRRGIEASEATVQAQIEDMYGVLLYLTAEVASSYIQLRSYQQQLIIKEKILESWNSMYTLNQALLKAGLETEIDVNTIKSSRDQAEAELNDFHTHIKTTIHHLSILSGRAPSHLYKLLSVPQPIPNIPSAIFAGLPSELLKRRPDIRAAERRLATATAEIGLAEGKLLPSFSLTGVARGSLLSTDLIHFQDIFLFSSAGFSWPIINFHHIKAQIDASVSAKDGKLYEYKNIILKALSEVEDALVTYSYEDKKYKKLQESYGSSKNAADLTLTRYRSGLVNFMEVLKADITRQSTEAIVLQSQTSLALDSVLLYKVLGGGVCPQENEAEDSPCSEG